MIGAFVICFLVSDSMRSTGIVFIEVVEMFHADAVLAAVILALTAAGYAVFGMAIDPWTSLYYQRGQAFVMQTSTIILLNSIRRI